MRLESIVLDHAYDVLNLSDSVVSQIEEMYSSPGRHYHTLKHVEDILKGVMYDSTFSKELMAAAIFHDVVYDTQSSRNELLSAQFAEDNLERTLLDVDLVVDMIMASKNHEFLESTDERSVAINTFLKADLRILWSELDEYGKYAQGIRKEYDWVESSQYIEGRTNVLHSLFKDILYADLIISDNEVDKAWSNMMWEINWLNGISI